MFAHNENKNWWKFERSEHVISGKLFHQQRYLPIHIHENWIEANVFRFIIFIGYRKMRNMCQRIFFDLSHVLQVFSWIFRPN